MRWIAVALLVTACGGGSSPVAIPAANVASSATPAASAVEIHDSALTVNQPPVNWAQVWREDWSATSFSGYMQDTADGPECSDAPGSMRAVYPGKWAGDGSGLPNLETFIEFSTHSEATFDFVKPIRLTGVVELHQTDAAWIGLTLIHAHNSYAEIALRWDAGKLYAQKYSPCASATLSEVPAGPRVLSLEYRDNSCRYYVDGSLLDVSACHLRGDPRVGIYAVNYKRDGVKATVGTLTVEVGK